MEDWWIELKYGSKRDQLSFPYVAWKNNLEHSPGDWKDNCSDGISEFKERILDKL
jgi:hypothetical protein